MNIFWTICHFCKGRGEVKPTSPFATNPPNMTGEIRVSGISVCKKCHGTGMHYKKAVSYETAH